MHHQEHRRLELSYDQNFNEFCRQNEDELTELVRQALPASDVPVDVDVVFWHFQNVQWRIDYQNEWSNWAEFFHGCGPTSEKLSVKVGKKTFSEDLDFIYQNFLVSLTERMESVAKHLMANIKYYPDFSRFVEINSHVDFGKDNLRKIAFNVVKRMEKRRMSFDERVDFTAEVVNQFTVSANSKRYFAELVYKGSGQLAAWTKGQMRFAASDVWRMGNVRTNNPGHPGNAKPFPVDEKGTVLPMPVDYPSPSDELSKVQELEWANNVLKNDLTEEERCIWCMHEIDGMSFPRIATELGKSSYQVRGIYHEATTKIQFRVKEMKEEVQS